jgi:tRNA pseudouridine55 synthase
MRVRCSAGTFIRTLAEDIGKFIGTGAHLKELRRTKAGELNIENSVTLDEIAQMPDPESRIIPMNELLRRIPAVELPAERVGKTLSGLSTRVFRDDIKDGEILRMIDDAGKLIAVGVFE